MYFPYFRGKQYELVTIRETAELLARAGFVPIIEPVKESLSGLERALDAVVDSNGSAVLVLNPKCGDLEGRSESISELFATKYIEHHTVLPGLILDEYTELLEIAPHIQRYPSERIALIHAGFPEAALLADELEDRANVMTHVFLEDRASKLYRRRIRGGRRILIRDGFRRRVNREHPHSESFSDLHLTYDEESVDGFGDFLIVGDDFSETGGPAYAVAIHMTYIDSSQDEEMFVFHFVSERKDTPTDPAGKFGEALDKLVAEVNRNGTFLFRTDAVEEFIELSLRGHFPGLGYVKKLSMKHHLETLATFSQQ